MLTHERLRIIACLLLIPLPLFLPYLWLDHVYFWANPDSIFYLNIYTSYRDALWQGAIFPHWLANVNVGLGSVVFYNLSPLVFHITAIVSAPFALSDMHQYLFGIYFSQVFGAWAMWYWMRGHYDGRISLLGAAVFTFVPYKWMDIYQHFTLGLCFGIAFLPLWFLAAEHIRKPRGIVLYGLAAALTFYAHALTVISVGPLVVAYALHRNHWQWKPLVKPLLLANLLAFCLVAAYLGAVFTATSWLHIERWSDANFNPVNNLYHIDDFIGCYALIFIWLTYRARHFLVDSARCGSLRFWSVALIILYVIATPLSYPLWANIPAMNVFQFPFPRLQPGMAVITALLCIALLARGKREYNIAVIAVYALFTVIILVHLSLVYKRPRDVNMLVHELAVQNRIIPGPIHYPRWTPITPNNLLLGHKKYKAMSLVEVKDGEASVEDTIKSDGKISLHVKVESASATMVVSQFYLPAWQAQEGGKPLEISPYSDGLITLELPKGEHQVELAITKSVLERIGDALTLCALAVVASYYGTQFFKRAKA